MRTLYVIRNCQTGEYFNGGKFSIHDASMSPWAWSNFGKARLFNKKNHASYKIKWLTSQGIEVELVPCVLNPPEIRDDEAA